MFYQISFFIVLLIWFAVKGDEELMSVSTRNVWPGVDAVTADNSTCASYTNCTECYTSSHFCHWCSDQKCHAKGSRFGCTIGASCFPNGNSTPTDACHSHVTCTDCSLASNLCHWCAFDDQCHAIGSVFGCAYGVNCYSNDRCRRTKPEYVYERWYTGIGVLPIFLILGGFSMVLCCSTVLYVATGTLVHGLYQILASNSNTSFSTGVSRREILSATNTTATTEEAVPFLQEFKEEIDETKASVSSSPSIPPSYPSSHHHHHHHHHHHVECFLKTCKSWYIATWILSLSSLFLILCFYPKVPDFNVCSDQLAWKSIIDGITSLKVEASFEILISIYNPNRLSLRLDGVSGKFKHDGDEIGTFFLTSSTIHAQAITDVLVTCTVVPDKWEALGIISDYYKGSLVLDVFAGGVVRIPSLGIFYPMKISDLIIPVNDAPSDRHLCSCPEWKDFKTIQPKITSIH